MSALPRKATDCCAATKRRDGPLSAASPAAKEASFSPPSDQREVGRRPADWCMIFADAGMISIWVS